MGSGRGLHQLISLRTSGRGQDVLAEIDISQIQRWLVREIPPKNRDGVDLSGRTYEGQQTASAFARTNV